MSSPGFDGGPSNAPQTKLRRALFGVRTGDVERALAVRDAEIEELRREIAALWQTYAQHDRAIREALTPPVPPPQDPTAAPAGEGATGGTDGDAAQPSAAERRAGIEAQLSGLDEALAAIEQATQTLEQAYRPAAPGSGEPAADKQPADR